MVEFVEARTQEELDRLLTRADVLPVCIGNGFFSIGGSASVEAGEGATVRARDEATVAAWGTAVVEARGSASVEAWGNATVEARDSATVQAWDGATVRAHDSVTVRAGDFATVLAWRAATIEARDRATVRAAHQTTVEAEARVLVEAWGRATVRARDHATVRARGSATVEARDSATVEVWGSANVRASDTTNVLASDNATVEARGSATVRARDSATVQASRYVVVLRHGDDAKVEGGTVVQIPEIATAADWCHFYGVEIADGKDAEHDSDAVAILYRAVGRDWDGAANESDENLHLSPRPYLALRSKPEGERFVACPVRVSDIVVQHDPINPHKVKARRASGPLYEVDIDGRPVE